MESFTAANMVPATFIYIVIGIESLCAVAYAFLIVVILLSSDQEYSTTFFRIFLLNSGYGLVASVSGILTTAGQSNVIVFFVLTITNTIATNGLGYGKLILALNQLGAMHNYRAENRKMCTRGGIFLIVLQFLLPWPQAYCLLFGSVQFYRQSWDQTDAYIYGINFSMDELVTVIAAVQHYSFLIVSFAFLTIVTERIRVLRYGKEAHQSSAFLVLQRPFIIYMYSCLGTQVLRSGLQLFWGISISRQWNLILPFFWYSFCFVNDLSIFLPPLLLFFYHYKLRRLAGFPKKQRLQRVASVEPMPVTSRL